MGLEEGLDLVRRVARAEIRRALQRPAVLAKHPRSSEVGVVDVERRPQRASGVSRRGLDPDALEGSLAQDATVGHAVEGDSSGHAQLLLPGEGMYMAGHAQHGFRVVHRPHQNSEAGIMNVVHQ